MSVRFKIEGIGVECKHLGKKKKNNNKLFSILNVALSFPTKYSKLNADA